MSVSVSDAVVRISGSQRTSQALGGAALREMGVIPLNSGDPNFETPDYICRAAFEAMKQGFTHYPPTQGDVELRAALAEQLNEQHGQNYTGKDILVTSGGSGAIYSAVVGLVNPGEQVLLFNPCFSLYDDCVKIAGAESVWVPVRQDYHLDIEALQRAITPRARMLILNSPCNPTAIVLSREELKAVEELVLRHDLILLSDEVYDHLVFDGRTFISALDLPRLAERTLLVQSFSKTYAMTGWRLGYLAGRDGLVDGPAAVQRTMHGTVSAPTQRAGLVAISEDGDGDWAQEMFAAYDRRRKLGHAALAKFPRFKCALPEAAFYYWVKVDTTMSAIEMVTFFQERGVAVRSGTEFGSAGEGHVRLTFAASDEDILEGIERMGKASEDLPR
jgi:aspartate aminotransferase